MSREDFALCTPDEFKAIYDVWFRREEMEMQRSWEVGRFVATVMAQPYSKKPLRPADLAQFPWEKKDNGAGAAVTKGASSEERVKELMERMKKMVNPSF